MTKSTKSINDLDAVDAVLADFTDRLLDGKTPVSASASDEELRALEETLMRLNHVFPKELLDEKTRKHLENNFKVRARKASPAPSGFAWWSQRSRQRVILIFAAIVIMAIFIVTPFLSSGAGNVQGTAGFQTQGIALFVILGVVIVSFIWLGRRK